MRFQSTLCLSIVFAQVAVEFFRIGFCALGFGVAAVCLTASCSHDCLGDDGTSARPNIVLVMADDQGWGQTGYNNHPILKTPNLDAMAANGLRFDRFYAAAPVCSPTRASVLTGRTNRRTGVESHGYALRRQEQTLAVALHDAGYATAHFGKWHLNGMRGPGVPVLASDTHHPGVFGFQTWLSVTNFFDRNPILSRAGEFEEFTGDSSEIIVEEAIKFIHSQAKQNRPSFTVIWFGTPHSPFMAADKDTQEFVDLDPSSRDQHGELVAMDRSIGALRESLRDSGISDNTILWFTSDNGGLPKIKPNTVGGLRGFKGSVYEGGLRVPAIVEWPGSVAARITSFPSVSMDIFPTLAEIVGLPDDSMLQPQDGLSLLELFRGKTETRNKPIVFSCLGNHAIIDNHWKLIRLGKKRNQTQDRLELYDLSQDGTESHNLYRSHPDMADKMTKLLSESLRSIESSIAGADYPAGKLNPGDPEPRFWTDEKAYQPYFEQWKNRPEYESWLKKKR